MAGVKALKATAVAQWPRTKQQSLFA